MKKLLLSSFFLVFFSVICLQAQPGIDKKLKDIKGKVQKITIKTNEGEVVFEGDEAAKIAKRLSPKKMVKRVIVCPDSDDIDIDMPECVMPDMDGCPGMMEFSDNDSLPSPHHRMHKMILNADSLMKNIRKNIRITTDDGESKVTIITEENGKKTIETLTGADADKKIETLKKDDEKSDGKKKSVKKTVIINKKDKDKETDTK